MSLMRFIVGNLLHLFIYSVVMLLCNVLIHAQRTIVFDPAGNTRGQGRLVMGVPEAHQTLLLTNAIQEFLKKEYPDIAVIITRLPGEHIDEVAKAQLTNKMDVNLYVRLLLYESCDNIPIWYIYQHTNYAIAKKSLTDFAFYPFEHAFLMSYEKTKQYNNALIALLSQDHYLPLWRVVGPINLPLEGIQGIVAPIIIIECGISEKHHWKNIVEPLANAIITLL